MQEESEELLLSRIEVVGMREEVLGRERKNEDVNKVLIE
jgi:hypothetical protein